jgi:hypothetical protein
MYKESKLPNCHPQGYLEVSFIFRSQVESEHPIACAHESGFCFLTSGSHVRLSIFNRLACTPSLITLPAQHTLSMLTPRYPGVIMGSNVVVAYVCYHHIAYESLRWWIWNLLQCSDCNTFVSLFQCKLQLGSLEIVYSRLCTEFLYLQLHRMPLPHPLSCLLPGSESSDCSVFCLSAGWCHCMILCSHACAPPSQ